MKYFTGMLLVALGIFIGAFLECEFHLISGDSSGVMPIPVEANTPATPDEIMSQVQEAKQAQRTVVAALKSAESLAASGVGFQDFLHQFITLKPTFDQAASKCRNPIFVEKSVAVMQIYIDATELWRRIALDSNGQPVLTADELATLSKYNLITEIETNPAGERWTDKKAVTKMFSTASAQLNDLITSVIE